MRCACCDKVRHLQYNEKLGKFDLCSSCKEASGMYSPPKVDPSAGEEEHVVLSLDEVDNDYVYMQELMEEEDN